MTRFDYADLELAALALEIFLREAQTRWDRLDTLVAERARLQTQLANLLVTSGELDEDGAQRVYGDIDDQLNEYDDKPTVLYRHEIAKNLMDLISRLRKAAQVDRNRRREKANVA